MCEGAECRGEKVIYLHPLTRSCEPVAFGRDEQDDQDDTKIFLTYSPDPRSREPVAFGRDEQDDIAHLLTRSPVHPINLVELLCLR